MENETVQPLFGRIKGKGARIAIAALLAGIRRAFGELTFAPEEREAINQHFDHAQTAIDSDGDGVSDDLDPAPHDATIRTAEEAARRTVEAMLPGLIEAGVARVLEATAFAQVADRVPNGGMPTGFAANTVPAVDRGAVDQAASDANTVPAVDRGAVDQAASDANNVVTGS